MIDARNPCNKQTHATLKQTIQLKFPENLTILTSRMYTLFLLIFNNACQRAPTSLGRVDAIFSPVSIHPCPKTVFQFSVSLCIFYSRKAIRCPKRPPKSSECLCVSLERYACVYCVSVCVRVCLFVCVCVCVCGFLVMELQMGKLPMGMKDDHCQT